MALPYFTSQEIEQNKELIKQGLDQHSYFVRAGIVSRVLKQLVAMDKHLLELGTGHGELAKQILSQGYSKLDLVDIDDYLDSSLRQKTTLHTLDVSFQQLPISSSSIDVVLAIAIFEHLENPFFAAREVARVLVPGGLFLISLPHIHSLRSKLQFLLKGDLKGYSINNNHIAIFSNAVFHLAFNKYFDIEQIHHSAGYINIFGKKIKLFGTQRLFDRLFGDKVMYVMRKRVSK